MSQWQDDDSGDPGVAGLFAHGESDYDRRGERWRSGADEVPAGTEAAWDDVDWDEEYASAAAPAPARGGGAQPRRQAGSRPSGQRPAPRRAPKRKNGKRSGALLGGVLLVIFALLALVVGGAVYGAHKLFGGGGPADYKGDGTGSVTIQVQKGDTADAIGTTLTQDGVVASVGAFNNAAAANPKSRSIAPGYYALKTHMSAAAAVSLMLDPKSLIQSRVTVPEGSSLTRTLNLIAQHSSVTLTDLQTAIKTPAALGLPTYANNRVEGFLFPATYDIAPNTQAVDALQQFTQAFQVEAAKIDLVNAAKSLGYTPYQIVTVASLIEGEAAKAADRPKVAEVIYNRLKRGMNLGLESTVRYALGGAAGTRVLQSQLDKAATSPYDTYTHSGLPPGPIDNPGDAALQAALSPAQGDDLYFVTLPKTNTTVFTDSSATFAQLTAECQAQGGC